MKQTDKISEDFKRAIYSIHKLQASIGPNAPMLMEINNAIENLLKAQKVYLDIMMKDSLKETERLTKEIKEALQ